MTLVGKYEPRWDIDVARGQQGEMFVNNLIGMLKLGNGQIEVKRDAWWPIKRRIYVERYCKKGGVFVPSGIMTTRALFWFFVAPQNFGFIIPTDHLLRAAEFSSSRDRRNTEAECMNGSHPTKGVFIYEYDIMETRDRTRDEH
jgi:hypothetical protein